MPEKPPEVARETEKIPSSKVAAARLIIKRAKEGKGKIEITPRIRELAGQDL
ncbi:RNA helicase [Corynebacterium accolens]|uniref:RNA helicase n=1 Tax=Corynebacterium accolens TaxID=38284 RepID=UPI00255196DB|nr:RNA helicase [Corynebacterium accolens]MDK8470247.1 RNA helicase [Corynebacterium accolens]MDK8498625.1 RNA helicase [Corynebacterium accolens]MDK8593874.1 RNA helicase [Corynebacterium accolens]MDK8679347.1 RNA helicase [Corynebacterium accolens]